MYTSTYFANAAIASSGNSVSASLPRRGVFFVLDVVGAVGAILLRGVLFDIMSEVRGVRGDIKVDCCCFLGVNTLLRPLSLSPPYLYLYLYIDNIRQDIFCFKLKYR